MAPAPQTPADFGGLRRWPRRLVIFFAIALSVVALAVAAALFLLNRSAKDLGRIELGTALTPIETPRPDYVAVNVLLLGFDTTSQGVINDPLRRLGLDAQRRAETAIIIRVDPGQQSVMLLSLPPALPLQVPGVDAAVPVASANTLGGAPGVVDAVEATLSVPIHRYMEIELAELEAYVSALGGVTLFSSSPMRDLDRGFQINEAGCLLFSGDLAATYARSLNLELQGTDGSWSSAEAARGEQRIDRDRDLLATLLLRSDVSLTSPLTAAERLAAVADLLTVDHAVTRGEVLSILSQAQQFQKSALYAFTLPVDGISAETAFATTPATSAILDLFRGDANPAADPAVLDQATRPGMAGLQSVTCRES